MNLENFKGIFIPDELLKLRSVTFFQKVVIVLFRAGYTNHKDLAQLADSTEGSIAVTLSELRKAGFILQAKYLPENAREVVQNGLTVTTHQRQACEWCKRPVIALQRHHYPVSRTSGGKLTVDICGTCHADYHALT